MVLKNFQSPQNIEIMIPLLVDPYQADGDWPMGSDFRWVSGAGKWHELSRISHARYRISGSENLAC